jgi:hypothetical protein
MKQEDIEEVRERFTDPARTIHTLADTIEETQGQLESLKIDLIEVESRADDHADDCDTYDAEPDIPEGWEEVVELLPSKPSVGDVLALKELVAKWRRDTYGEL